METRLERRQTRSALQMPCSYSCQHASVSEVALGIASVDTVPIGGRFCECRVEQWWAPPCLDSLSAATGAPPFDLGRARFELSKRHSASRPWWLSDEPKFLMAHPYRTCVSRRLPPSTTKNLPTRARARHTAAVILHAVVTFLDWMQLISKKCSKKPGTRSEPHNPCLFH